MLDVEGGENVNAGVEQLGHVLVAFGVAAVGRVGVGELIHQRQARAARQHGVQVHVGKGNAAIFNLAARNTGQALGQGVGFLASVGFQVGDGDVSAGSQFAAGGFEHGISLADARAHAEKDLEMAALFPRRFALDGGQERV